MVALSLAIGSIVVVCQKIGCCIIVYAPRFDVNVTDLGGLSIPYILADVSGSSTARISLVVSRRTFVVDLAEITSQSRCSINISEKLQRVN